MYFFKIFQLLTKPQIFAFSISLLCSQLCAQISNDTLKMRKEQHLSNGFNRPLFRDFATSPLYYSGLGLGLSKAWLSANSKYENINEMNFNANVVFDEAPKSDFFEGRSIGAFVNLNLYSHLLLPATFVHLKNFNLMYGGAFILTQNIRINPDLGNAGAGFESLGNLMLSSKIERDISRKTSKTFHFWFIEKDLIPVSRKIAFQLNIGLLNFNYRPGYAFRYDKDPDVAATDYLFSQYQLKLNGWRFGTRLDFTRYFSTGNGKQWSYHWDIVHAPGTYEAFQMASHSIRFTKIINSLK